MGDYRGLEKDNSIVEFDEITKDKYREYYENKPDMTDNLYPIYTVLENKFPASVRVTTRFSSSTIDSAFTTRTTLDGVARLKTNSYSEALLAHAKIVRLVASKLGIRESDLLRVN